MNWLLLLTLVAGSAAISFVSGWTLCRRTARREARAEAIRINLARLGDVPNYAVWRYRR